MPIRWNKLPIGALCLATLTAQAVENAPGEDPLPIVRSPTTVPGGPAGVPSAGKPGITGREGVSLSPASQARIARFEAKAMTMDSESLLSNAKEVSVASADGMQKVCSVDIGSAISTDGFNHYGPSNNTAQPVIIRGEVINICR